jgi:hypothetical protein
VRIRDVVVPALIILGAAAVTPWNEVIPAKNLKASSPTKMTRDAKKLVAIDLAKAGAKGRAE